MGLKPGYKRAEVGVIPDDWSSSKLHEASERISVGLATSVTKHYRASGVPIVRNSNIKDGFFDGRDMLFISEEFAMSNRSKAARAYDVLTVHTGSNLGDTCVLPPTFDNCQTFTTLITTPLPSLLTPQFLCLHMGSSAGKEEMTRLQVGGGKGNLNTADLKQYRVVIPPLSEQRAITQALMDANVLVESLEQLLAKKCHLKQGIMQELLTGKKRLPGFSGDWQMRRMEEICEIAMGRTPSRLIDAFWGAGYKWLSIADLKSKIVAESKEEVTPLAANQMQLIPKGTLLMSFKLSIGRLCFAGCDLFTNEAICSFNNLKANADFLFYLLHRTDFSLYGKQAVKGYTLNRVRTYLPTHRLAVVGQFESTDCDSGI
jgi:type I restriction enzyme S subunit